MAWRKLRLPVAFIALPAGFCFMFAVISGGVAVTQGPNADWTICQVLLGGLAVCGLIYKAAPVDWISDDELKALESREVADEIDRELRGGFRTMRKAQKS